jgi:hypothetical protein
MSRSGPGRAGSRLFTKGAIRIGPMLTHSSYLRASLYINTLLFFFFFNNLWISHRSRKFFFVEYIYIYIYCFFKNMFYLKKY